MHPITRRWTVTILVGLAFVVTAKAQAQIPAQQVVQRMEAAVPPPLPLLELPARLSVMEVELEAALLRLTETSGVPLAFSPARLPRSVRVSCRCDDVTLREALDQLLPASTFRYSETGGQVVLHPVVEPPRELFREASPVRNAGLVLSEPAATPMSVRPRVTAVARQGTISGRVVQQGNQRPVAGAQVSIPGTGLGGLSNPDGRYLVVGVPPGEQTVRVQIIGFATQERTVTVASGETVVADFQLNPEALGLDEIVVTGTAGGQQRRAIGNVVASLDAGAVIDRSPIRNVEQLLVGRTTGVRAQTSPGQVGTGSPILIRGVGTLTQGNDPIVYIDGVRMYSNPRDGVGQRGGANQSRLNDIHPADIESIEIIKGPAAATLYGTEASNGVIQIITKRGARGTPQFDISTRTGYNWIWNPEGKASDGRCIIAPAGADLPPGITLPADEEFLPGTYCFNVYENERRFHSGPLYNYGLLQSYNLAMRGGTDFVRYSASVSRTDDTGIVEWNWDRRTALRLNLETTLTDRLTVVAGAAYITGQTRLAESSLQTSTFHGIIRSQAEHLFDDRRGWAQVPPEDMRQVEARNDVDRTTLNLELRYQPFEWMTHRVIMGADRNTYDQWVLHPRYPQGSDHWYGQLALGQKAFTKGNRNFLTLDYSASVNADWRDFTLQPSVGFQYYKTENSALSGTGGQFPAVPITTVSGGAVRDAGETFSENATVGVYVQQMVGWKNRLFVTGAVRADDNSAFGVNFDAAIYPKISATWVISEEDFWGFDFLQQLRLRGAWGAAGKQPDAFAASRLYSPDIGYLNRPALLPGAFGNPDLKPERGEELEVGFDASILDGRVEVEVTHYNKRITDAILNRQLPPSTGFTGSQIVNVGRVDAWGWEVGGVVRVLEGRRLSWDLDSQWTLMRNEIKDMGGLSTRFNREGYPIQSHFGRQVLDGEIDQNRRVIRAECESGTGADGLRRGGAPIPCAGAPLLFQGPSQPTWQLGVGNTFTLWGNVRLYARADGNGGHLNTHNYGAAVGHRDSFHLNPDPMRYLIEAFGATTNRAGDPLYDASFLRFSELSATYDLPDVLAQRVRARRGTASLGMQNVMMLWTGQHGWSTPRDGSIRHSYRPIIVWDPDINETSANPGAGGPQTAMPPGASAILTLRFSF